MGLQFMLGRVAFLWGLDWVGELLGEGRLASFGFCALSRVAIHEQVLNRSATCEPPSVYHVYK